jgi:citrate lyase subunit beta/citryl-CoA lyase
MLFVPAINSEWVSEIPFTTEADGVIFDLEDGTPPSEKNTARSILQDNLGSFENTDTAITVRVNPPSSGDFEEDLEAIIGPGLDAIVLPKVDSTGYVDYTDKALEFLENKNDMDQQVEIIILPESAYALYNPYEVCIASQRVVSIVGATTDGGDFNRALGYEFTTEGLESLYARSNVIAGAKAAGHTELLSGVWTDIEDIDGLKQQATFARQLGYTGYLVIHPSHIEPINNIFTPNKEDIDELRELISEFEEARESGQGVIKYKGEMIDEAHIKTAKLRINRADKMGI